MSTSYDLPNLCAKCGEKKPSNFREIWYSEREYTYRMPFKIIITTRWKFNVPVCSECNKSFTVKRSIAWILFGLFWLVAIPFFCMGSYEFESKIWGGFYTILVLNVVALISYLFVRHLNNGSDIGKLRRGKNKIGFHISFRNKKFQKAFDDANPKRPFFYLQPSKK